MYKNSNRTREQEHFQNQLQTISQLLGKFLSLQINMKNGSKIIYYKASNNSVNQQQEELNNEPPPLYEAPPNYEETIKTGVEKQNSRSKRERRSGRRSSRLHKPR